MPNSRRAFWTGGSPAAAMSPRSLSVLAGSAVCALILLVSAAPASAVVREIAGTKVGVQPRETSFAFDGYLRVNSSNESEENPVAESFSNPSGHPVLHGTKLYAVYWDPTDHYHGDWQHLIDGFLQNLGSSSGSLSSVFAVDAQYTDLSNKPAADQTTFRGAYTDTHAYPGAGCTDPKPLLGGDALTCLTDAQVRTELEHFIATEHGLEKGMSSVYYLLTPPGVTVCVDAGATASDCSSNEESPNGFCSYHADISPTSPTEGDGNTILYAVIPWTAGGEGDGHLRPVNQTPGFACQDGGFNPISEPIEQKETAPHQQEPNQVPCPSPDGYCDTGLADLIVNQVAVEQQNVVTDPLLNAWQDAEANEATDECRNFFAPAVGSSEPRPQTLAGELSNQELGSGRYYLNTAFNLAALRLPYPAVPCLPGVVVQPQFTSPNPVKTGEAVGFDGMESDISLNAAIGYSEKGTPQANYATYTWDFGDGSATVSGYAPGAPECSAPWLSPCAASAFHTYQYGGEYTVKLTVRDVAGNSSTVSHSVTVEGPPPPGAGGGAGSGSGSGGSQSGGQNQANFGSSTTGSTQGSSSSSGGNGASTSSFPAPVVTAAVASHSLRRARREGLLVRYTVNEQVTGRFEVLLARTVAKRLGISGPAASGPPTGSAPQVVIAKAIIVTTAGGHSSVRIRFSQHTASRLGRAGRVALTLRMIVRNASSANRASATVLSAFTLSH